MSRRKNRLQRLRKQQRKALVEDSATVKTFYKEEDHIRLQPENDFMDPIIVPDCKILGKVFGVFRLFP